jgi:hypothetical protein
LGANLSSNLGKGQNYLLYGEAISKTYENLETSIESILPNTNDKNRQKVYDGLMNVKSKNDNSFKEFYKVTSIDKATSEQQNL